MGIFRPQATMEEIISQWWQGYKGQLMDTTIRNKQEMMDTHIFPALGKLKVAAITPSTLQTYISNKQEHGSPLRHPGGLSPSSIRDHFKIIKSALRWAVENGYLQCNPVDKVTLPRIRRMEVKTFSTKEVDALILAARPRWMGTLIIMAYRTGMRRGELFGLKWEDIHWDGKYLLIKRTIGAKAPHERLIHPPKTQRSLRRIDLDQVCMDLLACMRQGAVTEWVIEGRNGKMLSPWNVTKYMRQACDKAGIPHRCFHTLRHTHATLLLSKGINPKVVQERLGHSNLEMTLGTYGHVLPTMQGEAIRILNDL